MRSLDILVDRLGPGDSVMIPAPGLANAYLEVRSSEGGGAVVEHFLLSQGGEDGQCGRPAVCSSGS